MSLKEKILISINDDYRIDLFQEIATARKETVQKLKKKYHLNHQDSCVIELEGEFYIYDREEILEVLRKWSDSDSLCCGEKVTRTYPMPFKELIE